MNMETGLQREVGALDRPGQAAQALAMGDLPAAWRSMFKPQELTIKERDQLLKKWGLDKSPYEHVFRTVTNPILLLSLALSHKFPVPTGDNIFKLSKAIGSLTSRFPVLGRFTSMQALFRGTRVPDDLDNVVRDVNDFRTKYATRLLEAQGKFERATGKLPGHREQVMVSAWLDGLHKQVRGFSGKRGVVRVGSGETTRVLPEVTALIPGLETKMGRPLLTLARDVRGMLDNQWKEVFGEIQGRKRILAAIHRQRGRGFADDITDAMEDFIKNPQKMMDYFPRRIVQSEEDFRKLVGLLTSGASAKRFAKSAERKALAWASPEIYTRKFSMVPDAADLDIIRDLVNPAERAKLDAIVKARVLHSARVLGMNSRTVNRLGELPLKELVEDYPKYLRPREATQFSGVLADKMPRSYSLKLSPVMSSYTHTLAGTYGWTVKGGGEQMMNTLDELRAIAKVKGPGSVYAKARADMIESTYIPIAMGRGTFRQSLKAQAWNQSMTQLSVWMDNPKVTGILGEKLAGQIQNGMRASHGAFSLMNLSRKTAGYFYLSTLGLNPGAALKNTLQLVLTTGPVVGYKTTAEGLSRAFQKSHKYFALRLGPRQLTHEAALRKAYPEFAKAGLVAAPITDEVVQNTLVNAYGIAALPAAGVKLSDKIQRAMMAMFTGSETTVRVATFEAGMLHAARAKMPIDASIAFAKKLTEQTQFLTGPQNTPFFLLDKNPLVRQLTQFPLRMLEFATSTAFTLGSGAIDPKTGKPMNLLGRYNPGTFARMIAGSILAMELGESIGVNAGDALLGGALPTFTSLGKVGAPLPIIPPFFQIVGAGGIGLTTGDWTEMMRSTPLLVPGGVELFKVMGFMPPGVPGAQMGQRAARLFERTYADYKQPAPDGRIAVFSGRGTLRGYYRPWDLVKSGLGVKGGDLDTEQELLNHLVKNRDAIRQEKVSYLDARFRNDARSASKIARQFKQRFGFEIPVSEDDQRAMQLRRQITRLEQVVRTLPPGPARDRMIELISTTLGTGGQQLLGIDPMILGAPKPQREAARSRGFGSTRFRARTDLGPLDKVNPATIGRQVGANRAQPPY